CTSLGIPTADVLSLRKAVEVELKISQLISLKEAAEHTGLSHGYLRQLANKGTLEAVKFGTRWITTLANVDKYMASRKKTE
ncbi:MAG: DNA-binding protein, partial [Anaerolineales bacterium]